jgi:hypothetical protein
LETFCNEKNRIWGNAWGGLKPSLHAVACGGLAVSMLHCGWGVVWCKEWDSGTVPVEPLPISLIMSSSGRSYILLLSLSCSGPGAARSAYVRREEVTLHSTRVPLRHQFPHQYVHHVCQTWQSIKFFSFMPPAPFWLFSFTSLQGPSRPQALVCLCLPDTLTLSRSGIPVAFVQYSRSWALGSRSVKK